MDLKETGFVDVDWILLAYSRVQCWGFVKVIMNV
jgi:hypothetical protein